MLLYLFFLIPIIHSTTSSNVTFNKTDHDGNKTLTVKEISKEVNNQSQSAMVSEGGSILHDDRVMSLPNTNLTLELLNLDKETGKTKEKPIQARKGVGTPLDIGVAQSDTKTDNDNTPNDLKQKFDIALKNHKNTTLVPPAVIVNETSTPKQTKKQNSTKTEVPRKPLKLSYDALENLGQKYQSDAKIPFAKSSSKTIVYDQMPSPNKDTNTKTYSMASKHPGMVTPIVITILVVPMFAVLGYMAMRRGQEAWKNRHYKRMDFLLDGMYND